MTVVICLRDPDASNEFRQFGEPVTIINVDYGYADLYDPDEFQEWAASLQADANDLGREDPDNVAAAIAIQNLIAQAVVDFDHVGRKWSTD